jgi:hypothetical protein
LEFAQNQVRRISVDSYSAEPFSTGWHMRGDSIMVRITKLEPYDYVGEFECSFDDWCYPCDLSVEQRVSEFSCEGLDAYLTATIDGAEALEAIAGKMRALADQIQNLQKDNPK